MSYNADGNTVLTYVEKQPFKIVFKNYTFDKDFNFVKEELDNYTLGEQIRDEWKAKFEWFKYVGESYQVEGISVDPSWGGTLVVRKKLTTYNYSWLFGGYWPSVKILDKQTLKGDEENRLYMYARAENYQSGDVVLLVGNKGDKSDDNKYQHVQNFQLMHISNDMQITYGEKIEFPYAMCINYFRIIEEPGLEETDLMDETGDLSRGDLAIVFSPLTNLFVKKKVNPNPNEHTLVIVGADGKIKKRLDMKTPSSGWWVEDVIKFGSGDIIAYGPSKDEKYINTLKPTNSPMTYKDEVSETAWKSFQILKLDKDFNQVYLASSDLEEFEAKLVTPPSQKKAPSYMGKRFDKRQTMLTPQGEFLIVGQNYNWRREEIKDANGNVIEVKRYKIYGDLLLFQFDTQGKIKRQYGVRRDEMNMHAKRLISPQDLYLGKDPNNLYWVYGEIQGFRKGFVFDFGFEQVTVNKRKLLYYPTVAKIDLNAGKIGDFQPLGQDAKGKQVYYTNPEYPQLYVPNSHLVFVGEDKKGSMLWFRRMELE